jgi:hypothetical protein
MPEEAPVISAVPLDERAMVQFLYGEARDSPGADRYKGTYACLK